MAPVIDTIRTSSRKKAEAQDAKEKATGATSQVQGKRKAKAHTGPSKRTQPIRGTKITKRAQNADGDSSSSDSEPEDTSAGLPGSSDSEASADEDGSSNPDEAPCASHMNPQDDLAADDSQVDTVENPVLDRPDASLPLGAGVAEPSAMEGGGSGRDGMETSAHAMGKPSDVKPPMKRKVVPEPVWMPKPGNLLLPTWISKYAQSTYDSPGDGNCGFRCVAQALASEQPESAYVKQDGWFQVRTNLIQELHVNKAHWTGRLGGPSEIKRVIESLTVDPQATSVPSGKWMSIQIRHHFSPQVSLIHLSVACTEVLVTMYMKYLPPKVQIPQYRDSRAFTMPQQAATQTPRLARLQTAAARTTSVPARVPEPRLFGMDFKYQYNTVGKTIRELRRQFSLILGSVEAPRLPSSPQTKIKQPLGLVLRKQRKRRRI
ncbi:hypothetical protein MJO29_010382 [Puccinia striiformis f. sp. tritici]|nr:hypothetical protein MJO29_010382 [Puccinia striiformis f. sp. tritici]